MNARTEHYAELVTLCHRSAFFVSIFLQFFSPVIPVSPVIYISPVINY